MLVVQKYGGTSLATPEHIRSAASRIAGVKRGGHQVVVVVSAMGKMTNNLIALAESTVKKVPQRELDMLLTTGERVSMSLLAMALNQEGIPAISFTGSQCGIVTDNVHTDARITEVRGNRIRDELAKDKVVIVAGFQGVSEEKEITTLGRGGSDTTAVALAVALEADECEILTDVDGLFTADPKLVDRAQLLKTCTYEEALEFASLGAKMHPRSIDLAKRYGVKVKITSSQKRSVGTTLVAHQLGKKGIMEKTTIRGIASKGGFTYFRVSSSLEELSQKLGEANIPLQFFSFAGNEIRFLCPKEKADVVESLVSVREKISNLAIVSAVGDGVHGCPWILSTFLKLIRRANAPYHLVCINTLSVVAAIPTQYQQRVTQNLHEGLIERLSEEGWEKMGGSPKLGTLQTEGNA